MLTLLLQYNPSKHINGGDLVRIKRPLCMYRSNLFSVHTHPTPLRARPIYSFSFLLNLKKMCADVIQSPDLLVRCNWVGELTQLYFFFLLQIKAKKDTMTFVFGFSFIFSVFVLGGLFFCFLFLFLFFYSFQIMNCFHFREPFEISELVFKFANILKFVNIL